MFCKVSFRAVISAVLNEFFGPYFELIVSDYELGEVVTLVELAMIMYLPFAAAAIPAIIPLQYLLAST